MLYMVIENFLGGDPVPVYRRLRDRGRLIPQGIEYRGSWVAQDLRRLDTSVWPIQCDVQVLHVLAIDLCQLGMEARGLFGRWVLV